MKSNPRTYILAPDCFNRRLQDRPEQPALAWQAAGARR